MDIEEAARRVAEVAEELGFVMSCFDDEEAPEALAYVDRDDLRVTPGCGFGHGSRRYTLSGWTLEVRFRGGTEPHCIEEIITPAGERFGADVSFIVWRFVQGYAEQLPWVERGWRTSANVTIPAAS